VKVGHEAPADGEAVAGGGAACCGGGATGAAIGLRLGAGFAVVLGAAAFLVGLGVGDGLGEDDSDGDGVSGAFAEVPGASAAATQRPGSATLDRL
jgi:hypothetical protein